MIYIIIKIFCKLIVYHSIEEFCINIIIHIKPTIMSITVNNDLSIPSITGHCPTEYVILQYRFKADQKLIKLFNKC